MIRFSCRCIAAVVLIPSLAARGETPASHRGRRGAPLTRRDDRAYRPYVREEQRSQRGCIAGRMQLALHHGLLGEDSGSANAGTSGSFTRTWPSGG